jgi:hypothetical protein
MPKSVLLSSVFLMFSVFALTAESQQIEAENNLCYGVECFWSTAVAPEAIADWESREERVTIGNIRGEVENLQGLSEFFAGSIYRQQESIADSVLDAIGDFSVDFDIIDREWQYGEDEKVFKIKLPLEFRPQRKVLVNNVGKIDENGRLEETGLSRYTVIDGFITRLNPRLDFDFGVFDAANVFVPLEGGIAIKYVSQREHMRALSPLAATTVNDLIDPSQTAEELLENRQAVFGLFNKKTAKGIFKKLEDAIKKGAKYFSEEDKTDVFFDELFAPTRKGFRFFNVNSEKVLKKMKEGDILNIVLFTSVGLGGGLRYGVVSTDLSNVWRLAYSVVIRRDKGNKFRAKYIVSAKKGWHFHPFRVRLRVGLGPISASYSPAYWRIRRDNYEIAETCYEYDLNRNEGKKAFDALTKKFKPNLSLSENEARRQDGAVRKFWTRLSDGVSGQNIRKADVGLFKSKKGRVEAIEDREVVKPDGSMKHNIEGQSEFIADWEFRWFNWPKKWKEDESKRRSMRILGLIDEGKKVEGLDIRFSALFNDKYTTQKEYRRYLDHVESTLDLEGVLFPEEIRNRTIQGRQWQYAYVDLYITHTVVKKVLSFPEKTFWAAISHYFTGDPNEWAYGDPAPWSAKQGNMKEFCFAKDYPGVFAAFGKESVLCANLYRRAKDIISAFKKIKSLDPNGEEQIAVFNKLNKELRGRAILAQLIVRMGVNATSWIEQGLANKEIQYRVELAGDDLPESLVFEAGDVSQLQIQRVSDIVALEDIYESDRRMLGATVFSFESELVKDRPRIFMEFDSLLATDVTEIFNGWLHSYRALRGDKLLAATPGKELISVKIQSGDAEKERYRYIIELPEEFRFKRNRRYTLQYRLESTETALTEIAEVMFSVPKR